MIWLGFESTVLSSVRCIFSSERDKVAVQTYKENFGNETVAGDIKKVNSSDIPEHDILLGGFPCQPFSQAGKKKGFADTRGTLFFEIERILLDKKPIAFMLENVKQLKGHNNGETLRIILNHLDKAGYNTFVDVLAARDFGLPQNRQRIFLVGFRKSLLFNVPFLFPDGLNINTKVGGILEKNVDEKYTLSKNLWEGHKRRKKEHERRGNGFGYSLFNPESRYTNTLSARYYKDGSEILIDQINKRPRKLTPRECARLQGFPESFKIPVSDTQAYKQFGNSVSVSVIKAIAGKMLPFVKNIKLMQNGQIISQAKKLEYVSDKTQGYETRIESEELPA